MLLRKSTINDLAGIMNIINQARIYLKQNGIDQWQDGYPDELAIKDDIEKENSYVLVKEEVLMGTAAVFFNGDNSFDKIYHGEWLSKENYGAVSRVAVSSVYRNTGAAGTMMKHIEELCLRNGAKSIRINTHEDNKPMRRLLEKCGYVYCGIMYLQDKSKRLAFEKLI